MTAFFDYPKGAAFGRVVPKNKIYEHAGASAALKDLFITQVDQIVWRFKLAPETSIWRPRAPFRRSRFSASACVGQSWTSTCCAPSIAPFRSR